jgi:hypothetical protein
MENSPGFQVLEAIPSHPDIEQLMFPACREMGFPNPQNEQAAEIFLVPAIAPTKAVRAS